MKKDTLILKVLKNPNPPNRALMALELLSKREKQANAKLVPIKKGT